MIKKLEKFGYYGAMLVLGVLLFRFMYILTVYGDTYPHWDEWRFVPMQKPLFSYLFSYNNENMQVFTNAIYALVELTGLPFKAVTVIGGLVYVVTLFVFYKLLSGYVKKEKHWVLMLLMAPCLSDFMLDNLLWPATTSPVFYFLFIILAVKYGFVVNESTKTRILTLFMAVCSVLAMNVSFALVFTVIYLMKNFYNAKSPEERRKEIMFCSIFLEVMAVVVVLFWYGMRKIDSTEIDWSSLIHLSFYERFSYALLSPMTGFLVDYTHHVFWLVLLGFVFVILAWQFILQARQKERQGVWALLLIISSGMAAITLFRGDLVYAITDHAVRYVFYGMFFVPVMYAALSGSHMKVVHFCINLGAVIVLSLTIAYFVTHNRIDAALRRIDTGKECIEDYYHLKRRPLVWYCAGRYFHNIAPHLDLFEEVFLK